METYGKIIVKCKTSREMIRSQESILFGEIGRIQEHIEESLKCYNDINKCSFEFEVDAK